MTPETAMTPDGATTSGVPDLDAGPVTADTSAPTEVPTQGLPAGVGRLCPVCGAAVGATDLFCESCGGPLGAADGVVVTVPDLSDAVVCAQCGAGIADGYCVECGSPARPGRDHWVDAPASWLAAVCDRGVRHKRNEDAVAVAATAAPGFGVLVVCDGVSSASDSDQASLAAARAARDVLAARTGVGADEAADRMADGADAAGEAAVRVARQHSDAVNPPSCTYVAAVVDGDRIDVAWIGDSRAYLVPDVGDARQLSVDDSWATQAMLHGLSREEAESFPQSHAITRWLGIDAPEGPPGVVSLPVEPGWLVVCSDGLWNYCSEAEQLAAVLRARAAADGDSQVVDTAAAMVAWAVEQGGHDNISVALARLGAPDRGGH